jgi:hypothetical protein
MKRASFCGLVPSITSVPLPKSPILTPVKTISLTPFSAISTAFLRMFSTVSLRLLPLACGMVQNEHL